MQRTVTECDFCSSTDVLEVSQADLGCVILTLSNPEYDGKQTYHMCDPCYRNKLFEFFKANGVRGWTDA